MTDTLLVSDYQGRIIRLTAERQTHILEHPELQGQLERVKETIAQPELVIVTRVDETVHVYHRFYGATPVTSKYLLVVVKMHNEDAFILTAFFSSRQKKGRILWQA